MRPSVYAKDGQRRLGRKEAPAKCILADFQVEVEQLNKTIKVAKSLGNMIQQPTGEAEVGHNTTMIERTSLDSSR